MIIIFINYDILNKDFNYIYNLFYYLKFQIKVINEILDIIDYIENNYDENDIYMFYEIFNNNLFDLINNKYNKNIYYFINKKYDIEELNKKLIKNYFILVSNNYNNLINYNNKKILLSYQFDIDKKYEIKNIEDIIIYNEYKFNIHFKKFLLNNKYTYCFYNDKYDYKNKIIIFNDELENETLINTLILNNNLIIVKKNDDLMNYFFYNLFIVYDKEIDICNIVYDIYRYKDKYKKNYYDYINYLKKKLLLNNKKFYQTLENIEYINNQFGFIILRSIQNNNQNKLWINNIKSIRKYYRHKIYILDDNSNNDMIECNEEFNNVEIINSVFKCRGEILPYYYLYINKLFDKCIIIHDSTFINNYIDFDKYQDEIYYLWHFDHISNNLKEEKKMIKQLNNEIINNFYDNKEWYGCFGVQTLITYEFICKIQEKYKIFNLINFIDNREKRMCFERIFSVLCTMEETDLFQKKSIFGSIHNYFEWGYKFENYLLDKKNNKLLDHFLIKTWHGR